MAITLETAKGLCPFSRIGFTYTSTHKMLVGGTDGSNSKELYPMGVQKVADYVVGFGTELHYTEMVRQAALAQHVTERELAESFVGKPLNGYVWLDGYVGALLVALKTGELQLRGYAIDEDGKISSHHSRYVDVATGNTLDFERDLKRFESQAPSAQKKRDVQLLEIGGHVLLSATGEKIVKPAVKNFLLRNVTKLVVNP